MEGLSLYFYSFNLLLFWVLRGQLIDWVFEIDDDEILYKKMHVYYASDEVIYFIYLFFAKF